MLYNMKKTYQFKNINMLDHGNMVHDAYLNLLNSDDYKTIYNFNIDERLLNELFKYQYPLYIMKHYQVYHDCGKHISKYIDENGKKHYPDHEKHSYELYDSVFDNKISANLIFT